MNGNGEIGIGLLILLNKKTINLVIINKNNLLFFEFFLEERKK